MYSVNMVDLQSSEFEELKLLVDAEKSGGDVRAFATQRLKENPHSDRLCEIYQGLKSSGLIQGLSADNTFIFTGLKQKGIDFVDDYEKIASEEKQRTADTRRHNYRVAAFGAICGAVSGGILGFLGGLFSSRIIGSVSSLLGI